MPVLIVVYLQSIYSKSYQESVCYTSVTPCDFGTSVTPCAYYIYFWFITPYFGRNQGISHKHNVWWHRGAVSACSGGCLLPYWSSLCCLYLRAIFLPSFSSECFIILEIWLITPSFEWALFFLLFSWTFDFAVTPLTQFYVVTVWFIVVLFYLLKVTATLIKTFLVSSPTQFIAFSYCQSFLGLVSILFLYVFLSLLLLCLLITLSLCHFVFSLLFCLFSSFCRTSFPLFFLFILVLFLPFHLFIFWYFCLNI